MNGADYRPFVFLITFLILSFMGTSCKRISSTDNGIPTDEAPTHTIPIQLSKIPIPKTPIPTSKTVFDPTPVEIIETEVPLPTQTPNPKITQQTVPTATLDPEEVCKPFPSEITSGPWGTWRIRCGDAIWVDFPRENDRGSWLLYDYTPKTGRIAYGIGIKEQESDYRFKDIELWVYDYWTDNSTRWLPSGNVRIAIWSPEIINHLGTQALTILSTDGELVFVTGPNEVTPWATIGEAEHLTWSPTGDSIAYVKDEVLYQLPIDSNQPRKLMENVLGDLVWAEEQNALIIQSQHLMVLELDELKPHILKTADGSIPAPPIESFEEAEYPRLAAGELLWSPESGHLVFGQTIWYCMGCDEVWVYELSENLQTILTYYSEKCLSDMGCAIYGWLSPGMSIMTNSVDMVISPNAEELTFRAKVIEYDNEKRKMWLGNPASDLGGSLVIPVNVLLLDQDTKIISSTGERIELSEFQAWGGMKVEVTCVPIFEYSCVTTKLQIFEE